MYFTILFLSFSYRILEELQIKKKQNNAIKYIMQTLIIASGVNWADDPELLDTMIQLGIEVQAWNICPNPTSNLSLSHHEKRERKQFCLFFWCF